MVLAVDRDKVSKNVPNAGYVPLVGLRDGWRQGDRPDDGRLVEEEDRWGIIIFDARLYWKHDATQIKHAIDFSISVPLMAVPRKDEK